MIVLGIDPGTHVMGIGVVRYKNSDLTMVHCGTIKTKNTDSLAKRLNSLFDGLTIVVNEWNPIEIAIEAPFTSQNIKAAMAIGQAQAIGMLIAAQNNLPITSYTPRQIKQSVTNYGGSSKDQVKEMVSVLLNLDTAPQSTDASDAVATAICHINSNQLTNLEIIP